VADSVGDNATISVYRGEGSRIECLEEQYFPHSIGLLYSLFTSFLGFRSMDGEHKVMGLASYGEPIYLDQIKKMAHIHPSTFALTLDTSYFNFLSKTDPFRQKFLNTFGRPRTRKDNIEKKHQDIAASIQVFTEEYLLSYAQYIKNKYAFTHLVFSGGVALNCKFNGLLHASGLFQDTFVPANPSDE